MASRPECTRVRIAKGHHKGQQGTIISSGNGYFQIALDSGVTVSKRSKDWQPVARTAEPSLTKLKIPHLSAQDWAAASTLMQINLSQAASVPRTSWANHPFTTPLATPTTSPSHLVPPSMDAFNLPEEIHK